MRTMHSVRPPRAEVVWSVIGILLLAAAGLVAYAVLS